MRSLLLLLALCAAANARHLLQTPPTPGSAGIPIPMDPAANCVVYPKGTYDLDSCHLVEAANEPSCAKQETHVIVPALSNATSPSVNGFPGGTGSWACNCTALFTDPAKGVRNVLACTACAVCNKLRTTTFPVSHWACNPATGCQAPLPVASGGFSADYYVNCGAAGAFVQKGQVWPEAPSDVQLAIKGLQCSPL